MVIFVFIKFSIYDLFVPILDQYFIFIPFEKQMFIPIIQKNCQAYIYL